jgi:FkbM family methyltransferase
MITAVPIRQHRIRFFTPTALLVSRAASVLTKEPDTIRWIDRFGHGEVLWDIGANVGVYSLYAAVHRRASVLAFEPSAANHYVLTKNIQLNELSQRVTAYPLAFSGQTHLGLLNLSSAAMGSALSQFGKLGEVSRYWEGHTQPAVQAALGFSIDEFVTLFDPLFPNHLKIDVDGLELPILEGARVTLRDARLKSLMVELNLNDLRQKDRAFSVLEESGFRLTSRGDVQGTQVDQAANHLFERIDIGAPEPIQPEQFYVQA